MPDIDDDIVKVVVDFAPLPIQVIKTDISVFVGANTIGIGPSARLVSLEPGAHGVKLEVLNSGNVWVTQWEYTEP